MAREKNWQFVWNSDYASPASALDLHRYTLWFIAATLTGNFGGITGAGLWTLYASSDSVTAGTDSTDRWQLAGPYDGTKIVRGASTAAHSWIVLKSPYVNGSYWYLIISFNTSNDLYIKISWSKTAPSGGSTTATPSDATTGWGFGSTSLPTATEQLFSQSSATAHRFCMALAEDGQFFFFGLKTGQSFLTHTLWFVPLYGYRSSDQYPVFTWGSFATTGVLNHNTTYWHAYAPMCNDLRAFTADGVSVSAARNLIAREFDGSTWTGNLCKSYTHYDQGVPAGVAAGYGGLNGSSDGTVLDLPVFVTAGSLNATSNYSNRVEKYRGRIKDLFLNNVPYTSGNGYSGIVTSYGLLTNNVIPAVGSVEYVTAGPMNFPAPEAFNFA
jgi:hypothetical protein